MFATYITMAVIALVSTALAIVLNRLSRVIRIQHPCHTYPRQAARRRHLLQLGMFSLLIVLVGCSNASSPPPTTVTTGATKVQAGTTPTIPSIPATNTTDWTTYHHDNSRVGYLANGSDPQRLTHAWNIHLDGAVYAEPLVVGDRLLVATEGDSLYSINAHTGQVQWHTNVGSPVPLSTLPCGNIDPLGITGTPVYDSATHLVFAVAEVSGTAHILVGVDVNTGQLRVRRSADPQGIQTMVHQQRAALALSHGRVYIAYGGLDGDCGNYHGWIVALSTDGQGPMLSYQVPTAREGGIWAPSGPAVDAAGNIYVAVGNGAATQGSWDHTDSVLRLSPTLQLEDGFAPDKWPQDNASDQDLGSMGPLLLPGGLVFADGKAGLGYLLHANTLGGVGGQAQVMSICRAFGGSASSGSQVIVPCVDGLRQIQIGPGAHMALGWHAPSQVSGSPVVSGHTVYSLDPGGTLYALNNSNGNVIATLSVGSTSRFATPTLSGNYVFVGTNSGVVAATIS